MQAEPSERQSYYLVRYSAQRRHTCSSQLQTCSDQFHTCSRQFHTCSRQFHTCSDQFHTCSGQFHTCSGQFHTCSSQLQTCSSSSEKCKGEKSRTQLPWGQLRSEGGCYALTVRNARLEICLYCGLDALNTGLYRQFRPSVKLRRAARFNFSVLISSQ